MNLSGQFGFDRIVPMIFLGVKEMKLAIIGTGAIVLEALDALEYLPQIEKTAIFARAHIKGEELAAKYKIPRVCTDYAQLLNDTDVDFVYIGLVNSAHYDFAKQALLAGKNVIVEKPFTSTFAQAEELVTLAKEKNLYLFEAVTFLHTPNFKIIVDNLPKLGKICLVQANYSQYSRRYDKYLQGEVLPAFNPKLSGGALYDINIYNLNYIVKLFGRPQEIIYRPRKGFNGIDTSGVVLMSYPDFSAISIGAKDSSSPGFVIIQGEKGWLRVKGAPNVISSVEVCIDGEIKSYAENKYKNRMVHEFESFFETYSTKSYEKMLDGLKNTLEVMKVAQAARKSAGIVFDADEVKA